MFLQKRAHRLSKWRMTTVKVFAPAKINLALHVTGQCDDGFHELDTLVAFADVGDTVTIRQADHGALEITGPMSRDVPANATNLVAQVAASFWQHGPLAITIEKILPTAAGIGGGSADAAACYRAIKRLASLRTGQPSEADADLNSMSVLAGLGADIPMCVTSMPTRAQGIGDRIAPIERFPRLPAVLVNPSTPVPTHTVFETIERKTNPPMAEPLPIFKNVHEVSDWLGQQRNDLQGPACVVAPAIAQVLDALGQDKNVLMHRMSGSGGTCFGLCSSPEDAIEVAASISAAHPDWWVQSTTLGDQSDAVAPQIS